MAVIIMVVALSTINDINVYRQWSLQVWFPICCHVYNWYNIGSGWW